REQPEALLAAPSQQEPEVVSATVGRQERSSDSVLIVTAGAHRASDTDAPTIRAVWKGRVVHLSKATRDAFVRELRKGPSIVHIEADIDADSVRFEDGPILASQLSDLFRVNSKNVSLVVLSTCQSFRIGKALDDSGIRASLVATSNLEINLGHRFYEIFY